MKTVTYRNRQRTWRLFLFCFAFLALAFAATMAGAAKPSGANAERDFWVPDPGLGSQGQRKVSASFQTGSGHALIYVDDKILGNQITTELLARVDWQLEKEAPAGAIQTSGGTLALEQTMFGFLNRSAGPADNRLLVLFTDGSPSSEGLFDPIDQLKDADALRKFQRHSNEANLLYIDGQTQHDVPAITGLIARELQRLLAFRARPEPREAWLADSLAEGGTLLAGYFGEQPQVEQYLVATGRYPLVTPLPSQHGAQLLFASFLIDTLPQAQGSALGTLNQIDLGGRDAVEELFLRLTQVPLSFDAIFSNFVSYTFAQAEGADSLPAAWRHRPGLQVPAIAPYATYKTGSGDLAGQLAPYSFVAIDLDKPLSSTAVIQLRRDASPAGMPSGDCAQNASVLWKPVHQTRIAVYAVGCNPAGNGEKVPFRLKIVDQPSLPAWKPTKIQR